MNNAKTFSYKKIIFLAIIVVWIIFSTIYMINDQWQDFQVIKIQQAYRAGINDSVRTLMNESAKCAPVPLYYGDQKIDVISVSCLSAEKTEEK